MNIFAIILDSGFVVQSVLVILLLFSVASWAIVFYYYRVYKKVAELNADFLKIFTNNRFDGLTSLNDFHLKIEDLRESPLFFLWKNFYQELRIINDRLNELGNIDLISFLKNDSLLSFERALDKGANEAVLNIDKHRSTLASIATVTPFIGLFGTVWGIINSFQALGQGGGSIEAIAPGIAEALVATAVGLFAAIPASWFFNIFSKKLQILKVQLNSFSQDLLNYLKHYSL
jgi:biopolymer transport protein TolQ